MQCPNGNPKSPGKQKTTSSSTSIVRRQQQIEFYYGNKTKRRKPKSDIHDMVQRKRRQYSMKTIPLRVAQIIAFVAFKIHIFIDPIQHVCSVRCLVCSITKSPHKDHFQKLLKHFSIQFLVCSMNQQYRSRSLGLFYGYFIRNSGYFSFNSVNVSFSLRKICQNRNCLVSDLPLASSIQCIFFLFSGKRPFSVNYGSLFNYLRLWTVRDQCKQICIALFYNKCIFMWETRNEKRIDHRWLYGFDAPV